MSIEAEDLYREWIAANGPVTPMTVVDLIEWVLAKAKHVERHGYHHQMVTDTDYLTKLGYIQTRDGSWHLPG